MTLICEKQPDKYLKWTYLRSSNWLLKSLRINGETNTSTYERRTDKNEKSKQINV